MHNTIPRGIVEPDDIDSTPAQAALVPQPLADGFAVAGVGASAGGLEACRKLLAPLQPGCGLAFILILHLDPTHDSMMVDLLAQDTAIKVVQAADGMRLEGDHVYIIPPAAYLAVAGDTLQLSAPQARHGARLPVDFLFESLASAYGSRAMCVILSGTGTDGCAGLKSIKDRGGLVIVQDPAEAASAGMPRAAIATNAADLILPVAGIAAALQRHAQKNPRQQDSAAHSTAEGVQSAGLADVVALLRRKTSHDFTLYKTGTLQRRVERRIAASPVAGGSMADYLAYVRGNDDELELLARDLLINVTSFFRDAAVFEVMEQQIIPQLIRAHKPGEALRVWVAGCSSGEETYSLAMIFHEQIIAAQAGIKLQMFASDVDPEAVAMAREGLYPHSITAQVPAARLARFFTREENGYRISPDLRACVVFTVQDVLSDPPFSRLDLVSCRNLLIYLLPEAQARVIAVFHFALLEGGVLLLGSAETVGNAASRFEVIAKKERIYRHIGRSRPGDIDFMQHTPGAVRPATILGVPAPAGQPADLAELGKRMVLEAFAPAAVLINHAHECLFSLGPTERYLRVPKGHPSLDIRAMARPGLRSKLAAAIREAISKHGRVVVQGARMLGAADTQTVTFDIRPVPYAGEDLLLVCFIDVTAPLPAGVTHVDAPRETDGDARASSAPATAALEQALAAARADLQTVTQDLEAAVEEQKAVHQEAISVNEEYQSTNEELLTSKEELQSLNEELTALNSQLQETLERQRKTADDLQNVLYSTDIATLFLDAELKIRFFTPATKLVFNVIAADIGRPLADLQPLLPDCDFGADLRQVLRTVVPVEREIEAPSKQCYLRRIMPYRTHNGAAAGLVITFTDITDRKAAARALQTAQHSSESANAAKSRFLAAASHDLRQPLQTLALLQALLAKTATGERQETLVARMGDTVGAISGMLNTLLDINQIDAGIIHPDITFFNINDIFSRLRDEMIYQAKAQNLTFVVMPCSLIIHSDQTLLAQMIRNLVSNAFKYTRQGKVLLGCRRVGGGVRIEVWDTGIGIPQDDLNAIFEEYRQLDNAARERSRGLGLGLPIVERLAHLLGHKVFVRSRLGKGSVFAIEIAGAAAPPDASQRDSSADPPAASNVARRCCTILIVEDDPDIAELLVLFLTGEGHRVTLEKDGIDALAHIEHAVLQPDLILSDYNLPRGISGLQLAKQVRSLLNREVPVIILTGDISSDTLRDVGQQNCVHLSKPVTLSALAEAIEAALPAARSLSLPSGITPASAPSQTCIFIVDDDDDVRQTLLDALHEDGRTAEAYKDSETFLSAYQPGAIGCLLADAHLPGMSGLDLLRHLRLGGDQLPCVVITGNSDVAMAVQAMKEGANDFIEKPISYQALLAAIDNALEHASDSVKRAAWRDSAVNHIASLTPRQREIMDMVLAGQPSKNIAADLGISQRTVENHRASIMKRTGSQSLPALARLAVAASR